MLVWAEMNGLEFDHRVLKPWERMPAFYATFWAEQSDVPAEYLAQRRLLKELVGNYRAGDADPLPEELKGWRREVVGERLLELLEKLK